MNCEILFYFICTSCFLLYLGKYQNMGDEILVFSLWILSIENVLYKFYMLYSYYFNERDDKKKNE